MASTGVLRENYKKQQQRCKDKGRFRLLGAFRVPAIPPGTAAGTSRPALPGSADGTHGRSQPPPRGLPATQPENPGQPRSPAPPSRPQPHRGGHSPLLSCGPRAAGAAVPRRAAGGERQSQRSCRNWLRHSWRPRRAPSRIAGISSGFCSHSSCCRRLSGGLEQPGFSGPPAAAMPSHLRRQPPSAPGPDGHEGTGFAPPSLHNPRPATHIQVLPAAGQRASSNSARSRHGPRGAPRPMTAASSPAA